MPPLNADATALGQPPIAIAPYPFVLGDQAGWWHDEGSPAGFYHTYDALRVGGPGDIPRKVHVLVPRGYEASDERYPVVYMNDGDKVFWKGGASGPSWDVAGGLAGLYAEEAISRVLVVAILPLQREREYTHAPWMPGHEHGAVELYTHYVADKVRGFVDAHYRTKPEAASTAILGSSHGGLASFYMASRRPDRFGAAACLSPSFWAGVDGIHGGSYGGGALEDSQLIELTKRTLTDPSVRPRCWIDWGLVRSGGSHNAIIEEAAAVRGREMVRLLEGRFGYARGSDVFAYEDPAGEHNEASWARRFPLVMKALFGAT
jgi:pimeloyl-ACP methyl ester carboxylesterase